MKPLKGQGGAYKATINQSNYKEASYSQTGKVATPPSTKPHSGKVDPFLRRGVESANSHNKKAYSKGEPNKREPYIRGSYIGKPNNKKDAFNKEEPKTSSYNKEAPYSSKNKGGPSTGGGKRRSADSAPLPPQTVPKDGGPVIKSPAKHHPKNKS
jgi:hypothetical protein